MSQKKAKFNIVDIIVILILIAGIAFVGMRMMGRQEAVEAETYLLTFRSDCVPEELAATLNFAAREIGATPIGVTCNPDSLFVPLCDVTIAPYVGPEVISGSTRLKAGTAQKLVLNMLSTGAMIRTGKVYSNLMINVKPTNEKLWERATRIIMQIADVDHDRAGELLRKHGSIRGALEELGIM